MKHYLNLPEVLALRIVKQINVSQNQRVSRAEFVSFFLRVFMGSLDQKLAIAYNCFDQDGDNVLEQEEVEIVLKNIPYRQDSGIDDLSRYEQGHLRSMDNKQVADFVEVLFAQMKHHIFFDEFVSIAKEYTSELFFAVFSCIYNYVPCSKNVFFMR
mmetsp:Transcript_17644/g.27301  ORF Transcript_17644/g.27301 Transcript_17644/m.27301 type:complete len:156 (-) Transcript_17644:603-1070(-)|eukprot:CAMPEP_0170483746 /NCGR_PEP_ID=MMETSP0208-20121228/3368_1 /TAXON_ID=197538 /ORGANISM="Strombidium inclinatum, Strain S3" /LENGTH=155 /DNA_ID=CAMNT_0010756891 /DNA_START=353 /DNA_END=820 /DNA_ORIENTATION=-